MDILEVIRSDHDRVRSLWKDAQGEDAEQKVLHVYQQIQDELLLHGHLEETILYPAFRNHPEFESILKDSYADHAKMKEQIAKIDRLADGQDNYKKIDAEFEALIKDVEKHMEEEENKLFTLVRKVMKAPERELMGRHFLAGKEERKKAA